MQRTRVGKLSIQLGRHQLFDEGMDDADDEDDPRSARFDLEMTERRTLYPIH